MALLWDHEEQELGRVDVDVLDHRACDLALLAIEDGVAVVPLVVVAKVEDLVGPRARVRFWSRVRPRAQVWA